MPPLAIAAVAAVATTATGVIAAGSIAAFTFAGLSGALAVAASFATSFIISVALGFISSALGPRPPTPNEIGNSSIEREGRERTTMIRSSIAARTFVYGRSRVSGPLVFASSTGDNSEYLHMVVVLAGRELTSILQVYLGDETVGTLDSAGNVQDGRFAGFVRIKTHLGGDNQPADNDLVSEVSEWSTEHKLRGIAYVYVRLKFDVDVFPTGIPNISALVNGHAVYDPRTALTTYSANAALCCMDYLRHTNGLSASDAECDTTTWIGAANVCDEVVSLPTGDGEARFVCNGVVRLDQKPLDVMQALLSSMNGTLVYTQGKFKIYPSVYDTPSLTFSETHLRGEMRVRARPGRRELFNGVRGTFIDPEQNYQITDFPVVEGSTYVTEDNGERVRRDIELPFTTSVYMAQRLARIILNRGRQGIVVEFPAKFHAIQLEAWGMIMLSIDQLGWVNKPFRVTNWTISTDGGGVDLVLQEEAAASYTWTPNSVAIQDPAPDTNLPNPFSVAAVGATISDDLVLSASGTVISRLIIDLIEPADAFIVDYEVQYRKSGDANWIIVSLGSATRFVVEGVEDGATYEVRARARNAIGVRSAFTSFSRTIVGQTAPPDDVTGFSANVLGSNVHLTWNVVDDLDLSHYRIRWSPLVTGAAWGSAIDIVTRVAKPATAITVPALVGTYLIKAVDFKGIESLNATLSISTIAGLESFNAIVTQTEQTAFSGTHSGTASPDGILILDTSILFDSSVGDFDDMTGLFDAGGGSGFVTSTGTYTFSSHIDLGAVYASRVTANIEMTGIDYEDLFDEASGDFDAHDGLFDGETPSFVSAILEIRTTNDDPAGAPTWSAWHTFIIGDYSARAFQFRCVLSTQRASVTPGVSILEVSVDMPDRIQGARNITSDAAGTAIVFPLSYKAVPVIGVTGNNLATGDYWAITLQSETGFTVRFFNSAATGVARNFDWLAKGY